MARPTLPSESSHDSSDRESLTPVPAVPTSRAGSADASGGYRPVLASIPAWEPEEDDDGEAAVAWRARQGLKALKAIGRPSGVGRTGKPYAATGLWEVLEPLREMAEEWRAEREEAKQQAARGKSWLAERGTKLFDRLLIALLAAAVTYFLTRK